MDSYDSFFPAGLKKNDDVPVPKSDQLLTIGNKCFYVEEVKTNKDASGNWPVDEWPQITITGHYV
jgi:hypothetical protein